MNLINSSTKLAAAVLCGVALAGCNAVETTDESPVIPTPIGTVIINGDVTGLGTARPIELNVVFTNNGVNDVTKTVSVRGTNVLKFGAINVGANYDITISKPPFGKTCTIENGSGTAMANVDNVTVTCVRDGTPLYSVSATINAGLAAAPPAGFAVTLTTEDGVETIYPTVGQNTINFTLPVIYPGALPPEFKYAVTASYTVGGVKNICSVSAGTGSLGFAPGTNNITAPTVNACAWTISAAATYSTPPGGAASAMGAGGVQLGLRNQLTGATTTGPLLSAFSATPVAFTGTFASNSSALYEVQVESQPAGQFCIADNGGRAQLVTATSNVTVQVRCRNVPVMANELKGTYQLQPRALDDAGVAIAAPLSVTRNFLTFFTNGTFLYGTHHATATTGVEHGFYNYNPGAGSLGFTIVTDTNNAQPGAVTFSGDFSQGFPAVSWTAGLSGRSGFGGPLVFTGTVFNVGLPGNVTATNVVKTEGSASVPGTLSLQFGAFNATTNPNNVLSFVEPLNTPNQIEGIWATADSKQVFVYNKTTFYGFHAGVNGAPNLQDACFTIENAAVLSGFYTRRGGDTFCMATAPGGDVVADALDGKVVTGTVDVPNATASNTTAPLIPGFTGRLPGSISNSVLSPSPVRFTVVPGSPDTLTLQNTLNDFPLGDPVVFTRFTTY